MIICKDGTVKWRIKTALTGTLPKDIDGYLVRKQICRNPY